MAFFDRIFIMHRTSIFVSPDVPHFARFDSLDFSLVPFWAASGVNKIQRLVVDNEQRLVFLTSALRAQIITRRLSAQVALHRVPSTSDHCTSKSHRLSSIRTTGRKRTPEPNTEPEMPDSLSYLMPQNLLNSFS